MVALAAVAQLVERVLGKDEVMGSTPISSLQPVHNTLHKKNKQVVFEFIRTGRFRAVKDRFRFRYRP